MDRIQAMQMFMRVAEAGSFVRAAETLSLPASTVTSTIKNLEKYLKVRLLNRTTRRVSLTPEGMQYLAQCREILALIEHSESTLSESVARPQGRLRVDMARGHRAFHRHAASAGLLPALSRYLPDDRRQRSPGRSHSGRRRLRDTNGRAEQLQPGGPPSGPLSLGHLRVTGLSSGIWCAAVTGGALSAPGGALFLRSGEAGR
ncbi:transcription regulator protein of MDR efflux pump cluster [Klebsiella pneumoniae subsp. ozaenae]|uniref:Transcription regulator protein of MDR efflux pump cluster n=1 Tax=Klebsiella pneumoniae subsp. ozaenae TaxID=574 RepID=A0A377Z8H6_KLEPO|nr:transcription regulator protein of MDR efflux pump cluster [Klebsiella pneumoniae subsp. ozaenae]